MRARISHKYNVPRRQRGSPRPAWGNGGSVPGYAGSERARRAAHRGHISQRRAVTARRPRPALPLRSAPALHTYHRPAKDTSSGLGVPRGRGSARFPVTRPRCHRTTVPGVTSRCARSLPGRSLISAASTARWAQSHRASARCGAAPRPRAAARAVPHPRTPANDPAGQASQQAHEDQAAQTQRHGRSLCPAATPHLSRQVTAIGRLPAPPQAHRCSSQAGQASGNPTRVDIATGAPVLVDPGSTLCGCRTAYSPLRDPSCRRYS